VVNRRFRASAFVAAAAVSMTSLVRAKDIGTEGPGTPSTVGAPDAPAAPTPAGAEQAPEAPSEQHVDPWVAHRLAIEAHVGVGTPIGYYGGVVEYGLSGLVGVGLGVGRGSGPYNGSKVHSAVLARFRPIRGAHNAFSLGTAISFGGFEIPYITGDSTPIYSANWAVFFQADAGWEFRTKGGTLVRVALGFATLLNPDSITCTPGADAGECGNIGAKTLPSFDIAVGQAF
jgi:hypothetical protein